MAELTDEQRERRDEALALAYTHTRAKIAPEYHSRLTLAWEILIDDKLEALEDGSAIVAGSGNARYAVDLKTCDCTDFKSGKAPQGQCKHIMALVLHRRTLAELKRQLARLDEAPATPAPVDLASLPEAPISICMRGTLAGVPGTLVTIRGRDMAEIEARAAEIRARSGCVSGLFDAAEGVPAETGNTTMSGFTKDEENEMPYCEAHGTRYYKNEKGGRTWYSHRIEGTDTFCRKK